MERGRVEAWGERKSRFMGREGEQRHGERGRAEALGEREKRKGKGSENKGKIESRPLYS